MFKKISLLEMETQNHFIILILKRIKMKEKKEWIILILL